MEDPVTKQTLHTLIYRSLKRSRDMFVSDHSFLPESNQLSDNLSLKSKLRHQFGITPNPKHDSLDELLNPRKEIKKERTYTVNKLETHQTEVPSNESFSKELVQSFQGTVACLKAPVLPKPQWHPPWKLYRVLCGHVGWVRSLSVEPGNSWFVSGGADRIIKIWDLASCELKLSLTGHVGSVRGVVVSHNHPYMFSCGDDKQIKCWDLECNKVIRHYHGHLNAVYSIDIHPKLDILFTGGADSTARVWDMRTKACVYTLSSHSNSVAVVKSQQYEPQLITGSHDHTVRLWDLRTGKTHSTLTHHKKSIRAIVIHPSLYCFASASPDNIKQFKCPDGVFLQNLSGHKSIINGLAVNDDNVVVSGGDNGTLYFWDWKTGYNFQRYHAPVQPGSMDAESGIFAVTFDISGSRLITAEADKTIKIYKEDDSATEESHPVDWKPQIFKRKQF